MKFLESLESVAVQALLVIVPTLAALVVAWLRSKTRALDLEAERVASVAESKGRVLGLHGDQKMDLALDAARSPLSERPEAEQVKRIEKAVKKL